MHHGRFDKLLLIICNYFEVIVKFKYFVIIVLESEFNVGRN